MENSASCIISGSATQTIYGEGSVIFSLISNSLRTNTSFCHFFFYFNYHFYVSFRATALWLDNYLYYAMLTTVSVVTFFRYFYFYPPCFIFPPYHLLVFNILYTLLYLIYDQSPPPEYGLHESKNFCLDKKGTTVLLSLQKSLENVN